MAVSVSGRDALRQETDQRPVDHDGEPDTQHAADAGEQQALFQELHDQAAASRAQGEAYGNLLLPRSGARDQQIGHIGAGDQQNQCHDPHQREQRIGELLAQVGAAFGGGQHVHPHFEELLPRVFGGAGELLSPALPSRESDGRAAAVRPSPVPASRPA